MSKPKYTSIMNDSDFKNFLKKNVAKDIDSLERIFENKDYIVFSGKAVLEQAVKAVGHDEYVSISEAVDILAFFGSLECKIQFGPAEYVDTPQSVILTTPYVKFLSNKLDIASQFDRRWGMERRQLIEEHNAKLERNRDNAVQKAEKEYADNSLEL